MTDRDRQAETHKPSPGVISWMTHNRVTPNLLMLVCLIGGLLFALSIKKEVFPAFDLDVVSTTVAYPGASPEEVEQGIVLSIEEAIRGLDGIKQVHATANEGFASIEAELYEGGDNQKVYQDIKQEIDRIRTLPLDAEEPQVVLITRRRGVLTLQLYGDASEWVLRELAEQVRDRLLQDEEISQVELLGARRYEVHVDVSQANLRAYSLTLDGVARKIAATALELPGGSVETDGGDILLRVTERRDWAHEFGEIPIIATAGGSVVRLEDIAEVRDGFEESDVVATYDGLPSIGLSVSRIGEQTPIGVSDAVRRTMEEISADLPPGIEYVINRDRSSHYRQRLRLLLRNAFIGLSLVMMLLALFLEFRLAFWVTLGIPTSFLGAFLFLPAMGVSINMISMFAFIMALGIVVDDAIVAGENIYEYRSRGMGIMESAIQGARDVAMPVSFSIITNIVAFAPLYMVPGFVGKIWGVIPLVVITVFLISWVESLVILPAHLAHSRRRERTGIARTLHERQQAFSRMVVRFIHEIYAPFLDLCLRHRLVTLATGVAILAAVGGYARSGRLGFILMPRVESNVAFVTATLPYGSPVARAEEVRERLTATMREVAEANGGDELMEGIFALINENKVEITAYLTDPDVRPLNTERVTQLWREAAGEIVGLESLRFQADRGGPGSGAALTVELSHRDIEVLDRASADLAARLAEFPNVKDIDDGFTPGKRQYDFTLRTEGHSLGLTVSDLARQVRSAFYGSEALRQQRGRSEVRVMVRLPEAERVREYDVEKLLIRAPSGRDVPLMHVADVERGRAYTSIDRRDGRRTVSVTADVVPIGETNQVMATLNAEILPALIDDYPGLSHGYEGRQAHIRDSARALVVGLLFALVTIYALLVIPFGSYVQPLVVMAAIPFGFVGAVLGHVIMGYSLSILSLMGMIALAGVVVNDSLVLIDYGNRRRREGASAIEAMRLAGTRRFRPVILTTLTTFGGLAPMIFETSRQARFMVPMAISLGHGIVFATTITLVLVPCLYVLVDDAGRFFGRLTTPD